MEQIELSSLQKAKKKYYKKIKNNPNYILKRREKIQNIIIKLKTI